MCVLLANEHVVLERGRSGDITGLPSRCVIGVASGPLGVRLVCKCRPAALSPAYYWSTVYGCSRFYDVLVRLGCSLGWPFFVDFDDYRDGEIETAIIFPPLLFVRRGVSCYLLCTASVLN